MKATLIVCLLALFSASAFGQFLTANSSSIVIQAFPDQPWFFFTTLDGSTVMQNTSVNLVSINELELPDDASPANSTMVFGSTILAAALNWTVSQTTSGNNQVFTFSSSSSEKFQPDWSNLSLILTWDPSQVTFSLAISVSNYTWLSYTNTTTSGFFFGISDTAGDVINANNTGFYIGGASIMPATQATVTNAGEQTTAPVWQWLNEDTSVVQIGNFPDAANFVETINFSTNAPLPPSPPPPSPSPGGLSFWDWLIIVIVVLAVLGVIGALIAAGVGFYMYRKKQQAAMYDNI